MMIREKNRIIRKLSIIFITSILTSPIIHSTVYADCPDMKYSCYNPNDRVVKEPVNKSNIVGTCWRWELLNCVWCNEDQKKKADEECRKDYGPGYSAKLFAE